MNGDERDCELLDVLRLELTFLEQGGYRGAAHRPWPPGHIFRGSPTCPNFGELMAIHPCSDCVLFGLVPENRQEESVPCHFIALDRAGLTVASLERRYPQRELEAKVRTWLKTSIDALEQIRKLAG